MASASMAHTFSIPTRACSHQLLVALRLFRDCSVVVGQHGQSNYTTANAFLDGLIHHRRNHELPGSVITFVAVLGVGYM